MTEQEILTIFRAHRYNRSQDAAAIGVARSTVNRWVRTMIPAEQALAIETATGIPKHELRPDLWQAP